MLKPTSAVLATLSLVAVCALPALAAPSKPSPDEVKKVFDYFNEGKGGGPVLLELTPCLNVGRKEGVAKKLCVEPVTGPVPAGTTVFAFTSFFVPADDSYEISFEWVQGSEITTTKSASISTGYAYGTWKGTTLRKAGEYTIRIKLGDEVLGSAKVTVQ